MNPIASPQDDAVVGTLHGGRRPRHLHLLKDAAALAALPGVKDEPVTPSARGQAHALLSSLLVDDLLVPPPVDTPLDLPGETPDATHRRSEAVQMLRASSCSVHTRAKYGQAVKAWLAWCEDASLEPLPFDPGAVLSFLAAYAFDLAQAELGQGVMGSDASGLGLRPGDLDQAELRRRSRVSTSAVSHRLAGLNKAAEWLGLPKPSDDPFVQQMMSGLRRTVGTEAKHAKAALVLSGVFACVRAARGDTFSVLRDRAILLCRVRTEATAGQLASLEWADVSFAEDGRSVVLTLPATHRHGLPVTVTVHSHRNPRICLVTVLRELRATSARLAAVFGHADGSRLTRQGVSRVVGRLLEGHDCDWQRAPALGDRVLARVLSSSDLGRPGTSGARDRALLLVGFFTASRRRNLSELLWGDLVDLGAHGWRVNHRFSKTDQEGRGHLLHLPSTPDLEDCPAQALREWRLALSDALGREPDPTEPVFAALESSGKVKLDQRGRCIATPGATINEVVQRLVRAAGLVTQSGRNPYGAHSLRIGFVTEALEGDKLSIAEVAQVTGHADVKTLMRYHKQVNLIQNSPAMKVARAFGR